MTENPARKRPLIEEELQAMDLEGENEENLVEIPVQAVQGSLRNKLSWHNTLKRYGKKSAQQQIIQFCRQ